MNSIRIYTPESPLRHPGALVGGMLRDIIAGRELAWRLFTRDLSAQYRVTYLGYLWAFLPPLVASLTFVFLNSQGIVKIETGGIPYPAFAMMGTLLWQTFVEALASPIQSITSAKAMLGKINFPREALLVAGFYKVVFNFLIRLTLLVAVMAWWKIVPGSTVLYFPLAMLALALCGFALGLLAAPVGLIYGDVSRGIPIISQFWMLLTPVVYPARTQGLAGWLSTWNPVSPLITTARESLIGQPFSQFTGFCVVGLISLAVTFAGMLILRIIMPHVVERMGN